MPSVPREKYLEMNWRAADKVAAWKVFKRRMEVIFVADQIPEERQWALILVAGGDEAYNRWDTPFSKGTSFSRMLLLGPFRTTHSYFDNSVSICPTSVSHYKWTLSKHPSVHAKR